MLQILYRYEIECVRVMLSAGGSKAESLSSDTVGGSRQAVDVEGCRVQEAASEPASKWMLGKAVEESCWA